MKTAVIRFPGSNCERDAFTVMQAAGLQPQMLWHQDGSLPADIQLVIIPGGFSYGDYLRCGAMAAHSPIMQDIARFADAGGLVLGICNGFQILCEARLLPGTLMRNAHLKFACKNTHLRVEATHTPFTALYQAGEVIELPIAHHEGNYVADAETLAQLKKQQQILLRYCDARGDTNPLANPNGAVENIAGVCNARGNVLGLMPHPERHAESLLGGQDGMRMFNGLSQHLHALAA